MFHISNPSAMFDRMAVDSGNFCSTWWGCIKFLRRRRLQPAGPVRRHRLSAKNTPFSYQTGISASFLNEPAEV
jgi:hypothetical protein